MTTIGVVVFTAMASTEPPPPRREARILNFRRGSAGTSRTSTPAPVQDLAKYERGEGGDDYRHRMMMNTVAFVFVAALIGAGLWLAETMAELSKNQDCVLSGRRNCAPVEVNKDRW
jgi:hypothetical protein